MVMVIVDYGCGYTYAVSLLSLFNVDFWYELIA
jgi:hypothetical protein